MYIQGILQTVSAHINVVYIYTNLVK